MKSLPPRTGGARVARYEQFHRAVQTIASATTTPSGTAFDAIPIRHGRDPRPERCAQLHRLSIREREVLDLIAAGATNKAIARDLGVSPHTIKRHVANMLHKLGAVSRSHAVARLAGHA